MALILNSKEDLRKYAKGIRSEFIQNGYLCEISRRILSKILSSYDFQSAKNIALYYPLKGEIDLRGLFNIKDKNFFLPRCQGLDLEFVRFKGENKLKNAKFGLMEPIGNKIDPNILDIIYIPALIANSNKYRLGYGMGFYDRFFAKNEPKAKKIIVIAKKLVNDSFIQDDFDICADEIICE